MGEELSSSDKKVVIEEFKKWYFEKRKENLNLLITGKTAVGKSRLVNALVGERVAKEGRKKDPCTSEVTCYQADIEGVTVTVWDSPGLQDGTTNEKSYIQDMKDNIKDIALMIYCVRMDESKFFEADKKAIQTLTDEFGKEVWNHAVVALTFANKVEDPDEEDDLNHFRSKLEERKEQLKKYFTSLGLNSIPVIPVSNARRSMRLPDRENWLSHLWIESYKMMKPSARLGMYRINRQRLINGGSSPTAEKGDDKIPSSIPLNPEQKKSFFSSVLEAFFNKLKWPRKKAEDTIKEIVSEPPNLQFLFDKK